MDDKQPVIPQDEQVIDTSNQPDPGFTYEELHKEELRDIAENKELPNQETETETEKKAKELEQKEKETPKEEEEEVPIEDVIKETTQKALEEQERIRKEQEEAARIEAEKNKDPKTEYQEIVDEFEKKEGRTPTWEELAIKIEERATKKFLQLQEEKEQKTLEEQKQKEEEQKRIQQQTEEETKKLNEVVDDELNDLYKSGKLTKIQDPNNPSDQGVIERKSLFARWQEVNTERAAKGLPQIVSATRIAEFYWKKPSAQPAGADAPIMGNKGSATPPSSEKSYTYEEVHGKPWSFFKRG